MFNHRAWLAVALLVCFTGCVDGGDDGPDDPDRAVSIDGGSTDEGPEVDEGEGDGDPDPEPDMARPDADPPDMEVDAAPPPPENCGNGIDDDGDGAVDCVDRDCRDVEACAVDDCESACERVSACERLDLFGDFDACLAACARSSRREPPTNWFQCLQFEDNCGLIQLCRLPEPPPLTCDEVCQAADDCGVDLPLPDCPGECEARNGNDPDAPRFAQCGEALADDRCEEGQFWQCLADTVYTACAGRCETSIACNLERADGCLQNCVGEASLEDPLARLRGRQATQCIGLVGDDCQRADACLNPQAEPGVADRNAVCAAWDRCAAQFGLPCDEIYSIDQEQPGFVDCIYAQIRDACPPDPFFAFEACFGNPGGQVGPGCAELCEAQAVCDVLPDGQEQLDCLRICGEAIQNRVGETAQRVRELFPCGVARTCDELAECLLENSPATACEAHCGRLDGCGLADDDCLEECDELFFRSRQAAYRTCVSDAAAANCAAMAGCDPGQDMGCAERCARLRSCGSATIDCEALCDDESFADPVGALRLTACILAAPLCFDGLTSVAFCQNNPFSSGQACAGFCRAQTGCDPDAVDPLIDCVARCGEGFVGDEGLLFRVARPCIEAGQPMGACPALQGCIPDEPPVDCVAWCAPLGACDAAPADCDAACPEDELSRLRTVDQVDCLADAADCDATAECFDVEAADLPRPVDVDVLCANYRACGFEDFFPCQFLLEEFAPNDTTLACIDQALVPCPFDPIDILNQCFDGREDDPEALAPCSALCEARGRCGVLDGSIRDCTADCTESVRREPNGAFAPLLDCGDALSCPDLAACVRENGPAGRCAAVCATALGCGAFADEATCLDSCSDALLGRRTPETYLGDVAACLDALDAAACAAEGAACFEVVLPEGDCAAACEALVGCGLDDGAGDIDGCIRECEQVPGVEPQIECVLLHLVPPDRCDVDSFGRCIDGVGPPPDPDEPVPLPEPVPEPR